VLESLWGAIQHRECQRPETIGGLVIVVYHDETADRVSGRFLWDEGHDPTHTAEGSGSLFFCFFSAGEPTILG